MPPEESPKPEESHLKQIRTYEGDVAEAIKNQGESVVSIQQAEEARRKAAGFMQNPAVDSESHALLYAVLTLVLVALGAFGIWYAYKTYQEKTAPPQTSTPINQLIAASSLSKIDASTLSRQTLIEKINKEKEKDRSASAVEQIELYRNTGAAAELLTTSEFLTRLGSHAPSALVRALNPIFMLGVIGSDPPHTFMLIRVDSFVNAYPGMLQWEDRLTEDVMPIIGNSAPSTATTTIWSDTTLQ
ncbi:hypothetical protein KW796_03135, partial [Candidatus Parcubacteria bacterium]|nr:hypothetical protein [Candidatus Parcubacteria bacterium]